MKVGVAASSAAEALFSNPMRSLLTMLGIIIGVASVMVMMSIGEGAKAQIEAQISSVGTNVLTLQPGNMNRGGTQPGRRLRAGRLQNRTWPPPTELPFVQSVDRAYSRNQGNAVSEEANWLTNIQGGRCRPIFEVNNWKRRAEGRAVHRAGGPGRSRRGRARQDRSRQPLPQRFGPSVSG